MLTALIRQSPAHTTATLDKSDAPPFIATEGTREAQTAQALAHASNAGAERASIVRPDGSGLVVTLAHVEGL